MAAINQYYVTGTSTIIDDIVRCSTSKSLDILMLECMCRISVKYRASFKMGKCDFFFSRFESVCHDIMSQGNTTEKSKYELVTNWSLPTTGDDLHLFVSLCNY